MSKRPMKKPHNPVAAALWRVEMMSQLESRPVMQIIMEATKPPHRNFKRERMTDREFYEAMMRYVPEHDTPPPFIEDRRGRVNNRMRKAAA